MAAPNLEVRVLPIEELTAAPYNPRKHLAARDPAYRKLRASLETFGLVEPLVWNESTGHVVGGHARLRILRELGYGEVPVAVVRLTATAEQALNVVLNNQEAQGRFDSEKLLAVLDDLRGLPEFELSGFDESVFDSLRLEPIDEAAETAKHADRVEVTLVMDGENYTRLAPRLDELVREYDLETHIRRE